MAGQSASHACGRDQVLWGWSMEMRMRENYSGLRIKNISAGVLCPHILKFHVFDTFFFDFWHLDGLLAVVWKDNLSVLESSLPVKKSCQHKIESHIYMIWLHSLSATNLGILHFTSCLSCVRSQVESIMWDSCMGHVQVSYTFDVYYTRSCKKIPDWIFPAHWGPATCPYPFLDIFGSEKRTKETWREGEYRMDEAPHPQWPDSRGIIRLNSCRMNLRHFRQAYHFCISLVILEVNSLNESRQY